MSTDSNKNETNVLPVERGRASIHLLRGQKVMLDRDLAVLYGVQSKALVQAVKRNRERFPADFMFQLTSQEVATIRSKSVTEKRRRGPRYAPFAFTELGVATRTSGEHRDHAGVRVAAAVRADTRRAEPSYRFAGVEV